MTERRLVQPTAIIIITLAVVLAGSLAISVLVGGSNAADGERIDGQSPAQYQPEEIDTGTDPETGTVSVARTAHDSQVSIDIRRSPFSEADLAPTAEALAEAGHSVNILTDADAAVFNETVRQSDGLLIVQPTAAYPDGERATIHEFTDAGGHVAVAAEPTQLQGGGAGPFSQPSQVSYGATELTETYGFYIGSEMLYNVDDEANDNNFKSIYATPASEGELTDGSTVTLDRSGYIVRTDNNSEALYTAVAGTKTVDSRREGTYPVVARSDTVVFVADASFLKLAELYDAENEVFTGELLTFLASGDPRPGFLPEDETE